mgnify:CR=1 FL=1
MGATDDSGEHEAVVREAFLETMGEGEVEAVAEYFADTVEYYRSSGELAGRSDLESDIAMFHAAFPDLEGEIQRIMSGDGKVSFLYKLTGTHEGEFEGIPPTHQEMDAKGAAIARVEDGAITEYRIVFDNLGMLEQLGVLGE